ncbi:hypothetical protein [Pararhodospirillum oryzae]|uniref:Uncharacterized protein n=1 Tax=Pararhodospirillum oryzae TaxID=478448 RepID=A0A512H3I1_9PROT|nr:hypothetical protein [Pararhodospirillum oryzae]GEO80014.1 hypothetical protein ROR02_01450 [Pararhodospirillum oryzae]
MVQLASYDLGSLEAPSLEAPVATMQRVLTLIHDKAPSDEIDPELAEMEHRATAFGIAFEAWAMGMVEQALSAARGGVPLKSETLLAKWEEQHRYGLTFKALLQTARRLKSLSKEPALRASLKRFVDILEKLNSGQRQIETRVREGLAFLDTIDPLDAPERKSLLLYLAALKRRNLHPEPTGFFMMDGVSTPVIKACPPPALAEDPALLLRLEDDIHDEIEALAPGLVGLTVIRWNDANHAE